uniref:Uncharacterized protein n=1 Tax=Myoviridae sp. ctOoC8 TaxID=2823542 RepID=A0A8S5L6U6_9CAUD|nr:MAG TPA: hypothetical protein [Myoviridae sp. ctOoC8]
MTAFSIFVLSNFLDILFYVFGHFVLLIIISYLFYWVVFIVCLSLEYHL